MEYVSPHLPKMPSKKDALTDLAHRTGLSRNVVKELLRAGWSYREGINQAPSFVSPMHQMKRS